MADPTTNRPWVHKGADLGLVSVPMDNASMTLYRNQLICRDATGYAVKGAATAAYQFAGVATEENDEQASAAAAADGTNEIKCQTKGLWKGTVTGVAITDIGAPVFLTDSGACELTPTEVFVGFVKAYVATNTAWVEIAVGFQPRRFEVILSIPASAASGSKYSGLYTFRRAAKILAAYVNAKTYPDYATSVVDVDKYDLGTTSTVAVVAATDIDAKTAETAIDLTLTSTAADLLFAAGDSIYALQTLGATESTASEGLAVTCEMEEYGQKNA